MEKHLKGKERVGHRRAQTLPTNASAGGRVAEATIAPAIPNQRQNPPSPNGHEAEPEHHPEQAQTVGEIFQRRVKDYRRIIRWKAWFEARQLFINVAGEAGNQEQQPILVPEPDWLPEQAALMGEEAVQLAQQLPFKEYKRASDAAAPQHENHAAGNVENRKLTRQKRAVHDGDDEDGPLLVSSKQTLAEHLIFKGRQSPKRRNSEPTSTKNVLQLTAFEDPAAFRDYVEAATAELDDEHLDDVRDFGLLALMDKPVGDWGRQ